MSASTVVIIVLTAGLLSQWFANRLRIPAIVVLITVGLALGPFSGIVQLDVPQEELSEFIGLGVAVILFEGAMDLKLAEYRKVGPDVRRLTILGPPIAWGFGGLAAHYVGGFDWAVAWVLGAILVVTGPTVILPLLRQERLKRRTSTLLKWEGIVNDPVGVLLAVLTFGYVASDHSSVAQTARELSLALLAAALFGGLGGWAAARAYQMGVVPFHLKAPMLLGAVLVVFWASNHVQHESGLLSVTVMGLLFGNMELVDRDGLLHFKENLTVLLLSVLFIVIPSQLSLAQLQLIDVQTVMFVAVLLFVVRPATIVLATWGSPMDRANETLIAWIAPRGIVAAATAAVFGPALVEAGYADAQRLLPTVFLVIIVTVLAHGLTLGPLARRLGLAAGAANGLLIAGANRWSREFAATLQRIKVPVLVVDGSYDEIKKLRVAGIPTYYGEILSEHVEDDLELGHLSHLLAATSNDYYNALVCRTVRGHFGSPRTFQLPAQDTSAQARKRLSLQRRGYFAFNGTMDFAAMEEKLDAGWTIRATKLTDDYDFHDMTAQLSERDPDWLLLALVSARGTLKLYSRHFDVTPLAGSTVVHFSPPTPKDSDTRDARASANPR